MVPHLKGFDYKYIHILGKYWLLVQIGYEQKVFLSCLVYCENEFGKPDKLLRFFEAKDNMIDCVICGLLKANNVLDRKRKYPAYERKIGKIFNKS